MSVTSSEPPGPRDQLVDFGRQFKPIRAKEKRLREEGRPIIEAALRAGVTPSEVVTLTGYTRESVRLIARSAGIEPPATWSRKAVDR